MYLWIDLWDKRCWISIEIEWIAIPKKIVSRVSLINELRKLFLNYEIQIIIIGLPYDLYNKNIKQLEKTKKFIEKLKNIFKDKEIIWFDERFTSFEAKSLFNNKEIDDISACLILESYLKTKN